MPTRDLWIGSQSSHFRFDTCVVNRMDWFEKLTAFVELGYDVRIVSNDRPDDELVSLAHEFR